MRKTIGLMGAMDEEVKLLLEGMESRVTTSKAGIVFHAGLYRGRSVVACRSGVGKVNAAVAAQILIDAFGAGELIFTGVAGAVDEELNIGDIVISSECMQHDMDGGELGYERGVIPYQEVSCFPADPELNRAAESACCRLGASYRMGRVLSGDQFISSRDKVTMLRESMQGTCVEMEGAAVAQACWMNGVPFVIIRSMSDKADGSADMDYSTFMPAAAKRSHAIVDAMLELLE